MFDIFYIGMKPGLFAHEREVDSIQQAQQQSRTRYCWIVNYLSDYTGWDWLWEPVPWQSHQRHAWPSQHQADSGTYLVPQSGYSETNYHQSPVIQRMPSQDNWIIPKNIDADKFDWSWHPDYREPDYEYHFATQWQVAGGPVYKGTAGIKIVDVQMAHALPNCSNWFVPEHIVKDSIDYSWHPNPLDPPIVYHFDTQQHWNKIGGPEYRVPGAVERKYLDTFVAETQSDRELWFCPEWIDPNSIDYSWVPNPADPPYIYEFAVEWGWNNIGGPEYRVPGAVERKYMTVWAAKTLPDPTHFVVKDVLDDADDILRWRPNPTEAPYIYVFGNQWYPAEIRESARYTVPGATNFKFIREITACRLPDTTNYTTLYDADFDYSWEPDPGAPPYIYVFGNQWYPAEVMPTVEYHVPGAVERKYMDEPRACLPERHDNHWHTLVDCKWDYSWRPEPGSPPLIFVFGNQHWSAVKMPTVEYHMPGATDRKYMDAPIAKLLPSTNNWTIPEEIKSDNIDFSWVPDPDDQPYIYHFGSDYQTSTGLTYTVPGAGELKFAGDIPKLELQQSALAVLDIFYLDYSNQMSAARLEQLKEHYPNIQRVRYVNSLMDTIQRCSARATTTRFWVISSRNVYEDFDFAWHAQPWQSSMTHVFGSQWNKWSDTFLINRWEFDRNSRWAKGIEQFPNLNFVTDQTVTAPADASDIYVVDHGNQENKQVLEFLQQRYRVVRQARYFDNYLDTLKRLLQDVEAEHVWVVSSICDYTRFDFSWQPEAWQRDMLHVFPSQEQKFGDTFYVPTAALRNQIAKLELLDWFDTVNYCNDQRVPRWNMPEFVHDQDSHVDYVRSADFTAPLALFTNRSVPQQDLPTVSLWREKTKTIMPLDAGGAAVIVPRTAISSIQTQFYDYPYINKSHRSLEDRPLDIVFLSNGESNADANWQHLQTIAAGCSNRCIRVDGVNGRGAAYKAAADASETAWFFSVFAKLEIDPAFDFAWQPDRMQQAKHYIFNSRNPVNGLEYGHQGLIAYNKKLVLATEAIQGLDFTLSQPHGVEPVLSGVAHYNSDPWSTWRTAFREVVKLRHYSETVPDVETKYRLDTWQKRAQGDHAEWSLRGAQDAVEYYNSVSGNYDSLLLTFEWAWLRDYFNQRYTA
jgi:hypothetical protein